MTISSIRLAIPFLFAAQLCLAQQPAPIMVEHGLVQGTAEDGLTVYRGIPFAAPPVGDLRWRAPQPAAKWEGIRQTTTFGPKPIQGSGTGPDMSEDCLYLNVWTPDKSATDRVPVLVWIYGGGFSFASTSDPVHSGEKLAQKGVVLVSIAYRVGQRGFLAHPELSAENPNRVSGNYGLLECRLFVHCRVAEACARQAPAGRGLGMSWPIIDGRVIPDDQYQLYAAGKYNDTPILMGYNSDEGASFWPPKTPSEYITGVKARFGNDNPQVMVFNQTPLPGPVPSLDSLKVLDTYFAWRRTPEGEAWAK